MVTDLVAMALPPRLSSTIRLATYGPCLSPTKQISLSGSWGQALVSTDWPPRMTDQWKVSFSLLFSGSLDFAPERWTVLRRGNRSAVVPDGSGATTSMTAVVSWCLTVVMVEA